jgi:UDP-3-O-[3-hydroxymyristoyl] glucosamine N-acyltransferase
MKFYRKYTLSEIASLANADFEGPANFEVTGINEIHMVEKGDITFVDHPKYYDKALNSAATTIIINKRVECPAGKTLLFCDAPFDVYNNLVKHFVKFVPASQKISLNSKIGNNTVLQPGVFVGENVTIGDNCVIHSHVTIYDNTVIGNEVIIHAGTVIGSDAFYYKKKPSGYDKMISCGRVIIENQVEIGALCTIDKGVSGDTVIGHGSKLDNQVHIGHDTVIGKNCLFAAQVGVAGVVTIEDDVILWGQVGVQKDLTIGKGAVILGKSGVSKSLAGGKVYFGAPVEEARDKWKELALIRKLPSIIEELRSNPEK